MPKVFPSFCRRSLFFCSLFLFALGRAFAAEVSGPPELQLAGPWKIRVTLAGKAKGSTVLAISPADLVVVQDERHEKLPEFNFKTSAGWTKGARLVGVKAEECTTQDALDPESLLVRAGIQPGAAVFKKGVDYEADLAAGTVGRIPGGMIGAEQPVFISYRYGKQRIDSIVLGKNKKVRVVKGVPHVVTPEQPAIGDGETRLANVYVSVRLAALTADNLFPVLEHAYPETVSAGPSAAEKFLPKTLAKLRAGERVRILAWGDSVSTYNRYQAMFAARLRARFPKANIELLTEAWGGRNTNSYLKEPPGSEHNYQEKVLNVKPDLIISEFVNDGSLKEEQVEERYSKLLADFQQIDAEWVILTPHYIRLDWMGLTRQREIDEDPRAYVKGVRQFTQKHGVAIADASLRYGRLWRQGIPFLTLMENNINHPNLLGHKLFADSLIALFP